MRQGCGLSFCGVKASASCSYCPAASDTEVLCIRNHVLFTSTHTECVLVNFPLLDQISIYNAKRFILEVKTITDLVLWPEYVAE